MPRNKRKLYKGKWAGSCFCMFYFSNVETRTLLRARPAATVPWWLTLSLLEKLEENWALYSFSSPFQGSFSVAGSTHSILVTLPPVGGSVYSNLHYVLRLYLLCLAQRRQQQLSIKITNSPPWLQSKYRVKTFLRQSPCTCKYCWFPTTDKQTLFFRSVNRYSLIGPFFHLSALKCS